MKANEVTNDVEELITYLLSLSRYNRFTPDHRELTMRCPYCGDSHHDKSKTSFYLNVDPESDRYLNFCCFRADCGVKGYINGDFFDTIGYHAAAAKNIIKYTNKKSNEINKIKFYNHKELHNIINANDKLNDTKLNYINNRLGLDLSLKDLYDLKINLNLIELMGVNNIDIPHGKLAYFHNLSDYGISFISADNGYAIIRDVSKDNKLGKRYTNINLFGSDDSTKHYCIPTKLNLLSPEPTVINIAEGAFDILGVYHHHLGSNKGYENKLYLASCGGASITNMIRYYIRTYGLIDCRINIFSDSDVKINKYKDLYNLNNYLNKFDVNIYYNQIGKDFGVPKKNIELTKVKL